MGLENFIKDALHQPHDYIAYHIGRELAELHPRKAIIESDDASFDLEAFARARKCATVHETSLFNHIQTEWMGTNKRLRRNVENSWMSVLWNSHLLDVIFVTFTRGCYAHRHYWIVADDRKLAEEFFTEVCEWSSEVRGEVLIFHDGEWVKNKELYESIRSATLDNLVLRAGLKDEIKHDFEQFFAAREMYQQYDIAWKRGVLFIGPPGNGKTHTVKALVNHLARPCLYVKAFKSEYESDQENMRRVFKRARQTTPCLLVFEDLDSMIDDKSRAFFLNELDGFETNSGIVIIATTNHPEKLDPAILERPSRFDRKYQFDLPGPAERAEYMAVWNKRLQHELRVSPAGKDELLRITEGFSFAFLKELYLSSMMQWMTTGANQSMDKVMVEQALRLKTQMGGSETPRVATA